MSYSGNFESDLNIEEIYSKIPPCWKCGKNNNNYLNGKLYM